MKRHPYNTPIAQILETSLSKHFAIYWKHGASLVAQMVKRLLAMQETRVRSLDWEDPLKKEMATHSSTLAWKIPWTEEPDRLRSMGLQRVGGLSDFTFTFHFHFL